jgi:hypothetical protein
MAAHNGYLIQLPLWGVIANGSPDTVNDISNAFPFFPVSIHNPDRDTIIVDSDTVQDVLGPENLAPIDNDTLQVIEHYIFDNDTVQYIIGTEFSYDFDTRQDVVQVETVDSDTRQDIFESDIPFSVLNDTYQLVVNDNADTLFDTRQNISANFDLIFDTLQIVVDINPLAGNRRSSQDWPFIA